MRLHPAAHAQQTPDKAALILASTGETLTYRALDAAANRSAHGLRDHGLKRGDVVATLFENGVEVFSFGWAAQRCGLYATSISNKLSPTDVAYILRDSGARLLVVSDSLVPLAQQALRSLGGGQAPAYAWSRAVDGLSSWTDLISQAPSTAVDDEAPGTDLLYSSGTTGRPKGVTPSLPPMGTDIGAPTPLTAMGEAFYRMGPDTLYLSTSPLYHAAPLRWAMTVQRLGGTVVVMERFDPSATLELIQRYKVSHATFVPTHFVRLLRLDPAERSGCDLSSLRFAIHAAAPCPVPVKQAMIDWWGPILYEYYSGTETCGITALSPQEWLRKPGSVGRAVLGSVRILDEEGRVLGPGEDGQVFFADGPAFSYLNDPEKTAAAHSVEGWATLGDIGHLDGDDYLYLTDRKNFLIISGGVNIYPQMIENCLMTHAEISDVAVVGSPEEEMGEEIVAVIEAADPSRAGADLAQEVIAHVRGALGGVMAPRKIVFHSAFPREPNGKIRKAELKQVVAGLKDSWNGAVWRQL